jgi:hypothetical protein
MNLNQAGSGLAEDSGTMTNVKGNTMGSADCVKITQRGVGASDKIAAMNENKFSLLIPPSADGGNVQNGFCPRPAPNCSTKKLFTLNEISWRWKRKSRFLNGCVCDTRSAHRLQIK